MGLNEWLAIIGALGGLEAIKWGVSFFVNLSDGDEIIGMQLCSQGDYLLIVSEKGMGKRTSMSEFSVQNRGGKGVKCYKITEKTGNVVGVKAVNDDNEVMMITTEGIIIRIACSDISILGRIKIGRAHV